MNWLGESPATARAVVDALVKGALPIIREEFGPDCCIASARIALDVLGFFRIRAHELPVATLVMNRQAFARWKNNEKNLLATDDDYAFGIGWPHGPGSEPQPNKWNGHLVVSVPSINVLLDISLPQASRPQHGVELESYAFDLEHSIEHEEWTRHGAALFAAPDHSMAILIHRNEKNTGYRTAPDWWEPTRRVEYVERCIDMVLEEGARLYRGASSDHLAVDRP